MNKLAYLILVGSVLAIAVADVVLKHAGTQSHTFKQMIVNPWFIAALILYSIQVIGFGYLFMTGARLTSIGVMQTVVYAIVVITSGVFVFSESVSIVQGVGIGLSVIGVVLINM